MREETRSPTTMIPASLEELTEAVVEVAVCHQRDN
jgi:hypothetical protein